MDKGERGAPAPHWALSLPNLFNESRPEQTTTGQLRRLIFAGLYIE